MSDTIGRRLVADFGGRIGIPDLSFDEGDCVLSFDDVVVVIEERVVDRVLILSAHLHTLAGRLGENQLRAVAELGAGLALNGLGALALDTASGRLLLVERLALAALDVEGFERAVDAFVRRAETVRSVATAPGFAGGTAGPDGASGLADHMTIIRA